MTGLINICPLHVYDASLGTCLTLTLFASKSSRVKSSNYPDMYDLLYFPGDGDLSTYLRPGLLLFYIGD